MILPDNETRVDFLNNEAIASTIISMLGEHQEKPITIGVHGDWGAGKSSVLEMIEVGLEDREKTLCIKFNGWRYQGFEDAKIALIEGIVTALVEKRPKLKKASKALEETFRRINWLKVAKVGGGVAWNVMTGTPSPDQLGVITGTIRKWASDPQSIPPEQIKAVADGISGSFNPKDVKNVPEEIEEFRKAFNDLLREANVDRLVVLVDDLDRCLPDTAIETLEAIRLFVFTNNTAFVVAADEAMIEYAVRKHFPELPDTTGPRDYARNYLEKLIQVPFRIPLLGETETRIYVTLLLVGSVIGENDDNFLKLVKIARERLQRPWEQKTLDIPTIKKELGQKAGEVMDMLVLSEQIGPILANGSRGNPRQIKRFLNALMLRKSIAEGRGFGQEIKLPVLAKLMLAERFIPTLFDQIAGLTANSNDGKCKELVVLESNSSKKTEKKSTGKPKDQNLILNSWLLSETIKEWAAIEPKLAKTDLRPYLFVAKDKKDYFGSNSALGKVAEIADRLLASRMYVKGYSGELKQLAEPEAEQVFERLHQHILARDDFRTQPAGRDGLVVLVTAQPILEPKLLDLLESLPVDKLGAWVVAGWGSCIREPINRERFNKLLDIWKESDNMSLKTTAQAADKIGKISE